MAVRTKAALETQLTTLLADNTSGDISAGTFGRCSRTFSTR